MADIGYLRDKADIRVAVRDGKVVAGGLGVLVPQLFGGAAVPSAFLGAGCVAPEERGVRLGARMVDERIAPLRERGAVISTMWTSSNGYARHLGWEAPVPVFAFSISTEDLKRSFKEGPVTASYGLTNEGLAMQRQLVAEWNGPVQRPDWWSPWKTSKSDLNYYEFDDERDKVGLLSFSTKRNEAHGMTLRVHDFWAASEEAASTMLAFLGRHASRATSVHFQRGALPPYPILLNNLRRYRVSAEAWHPWMLKVLDAPQAIRLRGWPKDLSINLALGLEGDVDEDPSVYKFHVEDGNAEIVLASCEADVFLSRRHLAVWYSGGYRSISAARMAGVQFSSSRHLASLVRATADFEPWMPDLL